MQPIRVNYVTGNKGNVGKTAFANALIEFYRQNNVGLIKIDADSDSQTLSKMYKDAMLLVLSDDPRLSSQTDIIFRLAYAESQKESGRQDLLVDLPAGGEKDINRWMKECGLAEDAATYGISFVKWWVCDSDPYSIELFETSLKENPDVKHIFLKNMGRSSANNWKTFDKKKTLHSLIKKQSALVLEIPLVDAETLNSLREQSISFEQARSKDFLQVDPTQHLRIKGWLMRMERMLGDTISIPNEVRPVAKAKKEAATVVN